MKARDVELVLVGILQVFAEAEGDGHAGFEVELELRQLDADACADLHAHGGGDVEAVKLRRRLRAKDRPQVSDLRPDVASGFQLDIHHRVVFLEEHLPGAAIAGERAGFLRLAGAGLVVIHGHEHLAVEIQREAANRPERLIVVRLTHIQCKDNAAAFAGEQILGAAEDEILVLDDVARHHVSVEDDAETELYFNAQLQVDVHCRAGRQPHLDGKLHTKGRRDAKGLEVVGVVNGVVFEHHCHLHREAGLKLSGRGVALFGLLKGVVRKRALCKFLELLSVIFMDGLKEIHNGAKLLVGALEVFQRGVFLILVVAGAAGASSATGVGRCAGAGIGGRGTAGSSWIIGVVGPIRLDPFIAAALLLDGLIGCGGVSAIILGDRLLDGGALVRVICVIGGGALGHGFSVGGGGVHVIDAVVVHIAVDGGAALIVVRAGIIGLLGFEDRKSDRHTHLIAVGDDRGVLAQFKFQTRHLHAEIRGELLCVHVAARAGTLPRVELVPGAHVVDVVRGVHGGYFAQGDGFIFHVSKGSKGLALILNAHGKAGAAQHGAEVAVDVGLAVHSVDVCPAAGIVEHGLSCQ